MNCEAKPSPLRKDIRLVNFMEQEKGRQKLWSVSWKKKGLRSTSTMNNYEADEG